MRFLVLILSLCCTLALPARGESTLETTGPHSRPPDALDSVLLKNGEVVRGVVLASSEDAVTIRLVSGVQRIIPQTEVRLVNAWKPAPAPPPREPGIIAVADDGSSVLTKRSGLTVQLEPVEFYRQIGRDDLAVALEGRLQTKRNIIMGGAALGMIASALFFGNAIYQLSNCPGLGDEGCGPLSPEPSTANPRVSAALEIGAAVGTGLGIGLIVYGVSQETDEGGPEQRRVLAADYNAHIAKRETGGTDAGASQDLPTASPPRVDDQAQLRTLRAIPITADGARGLALGISF